MVHQVLRRQTHVRVLLQQPLDRLPTLRLNHARHTHIVRQVQEGGVVVVRVLRDDRFDDILLLVPVERQPTAQPTLTHTPQRPQQIEDDAQRPHVCLRRVALLRDHLGGYPSLFHLSPTDVVQRAARVVQPLLREHQLREAEVADLHVEQVLIAQNVLRLTLTPTTHTHLDVTVNDSDAMQVAQTVRQRVDDLERLLLREDGAAADPVEELAAT